MSIFLLCVQDNGGAGVVVTTSQTISSDSMVSHKRIKASVILHLTCHDYEKSRISVSPGYLDKSATFINQSAARDQ